MSTARGIRILILLNALNGLGGWITALSMYTLVTFRGHGSTRDNAGILFFSIAPAVLLTPFVPRLFARIAVAHAVAISFLVEALLVTGMSFARGEPTLFTLLALSGSFAVVVAPAQFLLIRALAGDAESLGPANAAISQWNAVVKIAAPIAAGVVVTALSARGALWLDAVLCLAASFVAVRLPTRTPETTEGADPVASSANDRHGVLKSSWLLFATVATATSQAVGIDVFLPVYLRDHLHSGPAAFSIVLASFAAGAFAVSTILRRAREGRGSLVFGIFLAASLPLACLAAVTSNAPSAVQLVVFCAACAIGGGGGTACIVITVNTMLQRTYEGRRLTAAGALLTWFIVCGQAAVILSGTLGSGLPNLVVVVFSFFALLTLIVGLLVVRAEATNTLGTAREVA